MQNIEKKKQFNIKVFFNVKLYVGFQFSTFSNKISPY